MTGAQLPGPERHVQPPKRCRPPPRLRTKTGCLTCRKRRKKCDEQRPVCQTCERLELDCQWDGPVERSRDRRLMTRCPSESSSSSSNSNAMVLSRASSPPKQLSGLAPFSTVDDQFLFNFFNVHVLPSLIRQHIDPVYLEHSSLHSIACNCPWVMNALLSLSSHQLSWLQSKNGDSAVPYFAKAVMELRKNMSSLSATDDSLLVAVTFLGLYEELRSDKFSQSMVHFNTVSRLLRARLSEPTNAAESPARSVLLRLHAESAMYHLSTRAIFTDRLPDEREWAQLESFLSMRPAPEATVWTEAPLLGSIPRLFTLILEATRLSRSVPLDEAHVKKAQSYLVEIQAARTRLDFIRSQALPGNNHHEPTLEVEIDCAPRLCMLALEIFLFKIIDPVATHATNPEVQKRVDEAHALFQGAPFQEVYAEFRHGPNSAYPYTECNCWPLMIIGCAAIREDHVATLKAIFINLWRVRFNGYVRRVIRVVDAGWNANLRYRTGTGPTPDSPNSQAQNSKDGLDILIPKGGSCLEQHELTAIGTGLLHAFEGMRKENSDVAEI